MLVVPLLPYAPSRGQECFKKERVWPSVFCGSKESESTVKVWPVNVKFSATTLTKRIGKDHMIHCFFNVLAA